MARNVMQCRAPTRGFYSYLCSPGKGIFFSLFIVLFTINQHCNDRVIMITVTTRQMKMFEVQIACKMLTLEHEKFQWPGVYSVCVGSGGRTHVLLGGKGRKKGKRLP